MARKKIRLTEVVGKDDRFENSKFWMENGVDLEKRRISLLSEVDENSMRYVIRGIEKMLDVDPGAPIDVEIGSYGGDAYDSFAIYDIIRGCPCTVRTHAQGKVMSAGFNIYLAGDERYSLDHTRFMVHTAAGDTSGKHFEQQVDIKELNQINETMCEIFANRTNKTKTWWKRKLKTNDCYLGFDDAWDLDIITHEYEEVEE